MTTLILAITVFILVALGLAIGVLSGRRPIKGSCGGCADCVFKNRGIQ